MKYLKKSLTLTIRILEYYFKNLLFVKRVKPHKKKKLRTLQQDITASTEYEDYISKLEGLPKLDPQATDAAPPGGEARKETTRRDSSEDEAIVAKLSNTLPQSEQTKSRNPGMSIIRKLLTFPTMCVKTVVAILLRGSSGCEVF